MGLRCRQRGGGRPRLGKGRVRRSVGGGHARCARGGLGAYSAEGGWRQLKAGGSLRLVVADTGSSHSTAEMVGAVSRFRDENGAEFDAMATESARIAREGERP